MARFILEEPGEDVTAGGDDVDIIGTTSGGEVITVTSGNITFDASFNQGGDTISLPGEAEDYTVTFSGSRLIITSVINDVTISVPVPAPGDVYTLVFREDGDTRLVTSNEDGQAVVGDETFNQGETDQLDSNDEETLTDAIEQFQDADQAIDDFEDEQEMTLEEIYEAEAECEAELAADRADATDEELEENRDLQQAEADAAQDDVNSVDGLPEAIERYEDAVAAEEATSDRETEAEAEVAAAEARYNVLNPEDNPIHILEDGETHSDGISGEDIIVRDEETGDLVLTEYGEGQDGAQELLDAIIEREAAEDADDDAEDELTEAEEELDLIDQNSDADDEREDADDFEDAVAEFEEELAEYEADPSTANAAGLEAAYNALNVESGGDTAVVDDTDADTMIEASEIADQQDEVFDAIDAERQENRDNILAAEDGSNPLYEALQEEQAEADAAQDAVDDRNEEIAECEAIGETADEARALEAARDAAADNVEAQGDYETPRTVDGDEEATEGNDIFVAGDEDGEDGTIFDFGADGNDALFFGEEYTVVMLEEGTDVENESVGDNDVLEAFVVETEDGVMVYLEENTESGNETDGDFSGPEILLDGVTMDDITVQEGFVFG